MSLDSRMDRLDADRSLNAACQAITASAAMLRATELQVHEIQDRQGYSPREATLLCEQVVALRDLLKLRLSELDTGAKLDGPISRGPSPSRVTAGSRLAWVVDRDRGGSVPPMRASAVPPKQGASSFKQIRRGSTGCNLSSLPQLIPQLSPTRDEAGVEVLPLLETISAVLIDLDGTMYSPHGPISGADGAFAPHPSPHHPTPPTQRGSTLPHLVTGPGSGCLAERQLGDAAPSPHCTLPDDPPPLCGV